MRQTRAPNATLDDLAELHRELEDLRTTTGRAQHESDRQAKDDLTKASNELETLLTQLRRDTEKSLEEVRNLASTAASQSANSLSRSDQADANLEALTAEVRELRAAVVSLPAELERHGAELRVEIRAAASDAQSLAERHASDECARLSTELRADVDQLCSALQKECQRLENFCSSKTEACEAAMREATACTLQRLEQQSQEQASALEEAKRTLQSEALALEQRLGNRLDEETRRLRNEVQALDKVHGERIQQLETLVSSNCEHLRRHDAELQSAEAHIERVWSDASSGLAEAKARHEQAMEAVDRDLKWQRSLCSEVSGFATRRVEWTIADAARRLREFKNELAQPETSLWLSPKFSAGGARDLQIELVPFTSGGGISPPCDVPDLSLLLWGVQGLHLTCRATVGTEVIEISHSFDGESPYRVEGLCRVAEELSRHDGSLRVLLEVHDATVDRVGERGASRTDAQSRCQDAAVPISGTIRLQTYLNHRLMELIKSQGRGLAELVQRKVDLVRSRFIRRVQWRLESAAMLRQCFSEGKAVCSTAFQAAGVSGLQLVFYPSGCSGSREGFCSFFLSCPVGCVLRCWLWAGRWKREARAEPADREDLIGRVNFCRFENCMDPVDESVELAIEIEEAQQVSKDDFAGDPLLISCDRDMSKPASAASRRGSDLDRTDLTTVKLGSKPVSKTSQSQVHQLPAIWTSQGFHTFAELRDSGHSDCGNLESSGCGGEDGLAPRPVSPLQLAHLLPQPGPGGRPSAGAARPRSMATPRSARQPKAGNFLCGTPHKYREYLAV